MIREAAAGDAARREEFARQYAGPVSAYLRARWRSSPLLQEVDDAAQEVFIESFRDGGALARATESRAGAAGFRGFLYGVARNVALRFEQKHNRRREGQGPEGLLTDGVVADDATLSRVFDRSWATGVMREAAGRYAVAAVDAAAQRRVDLLRLRFGEGLPIRVIAEQWGLPAEVLHREFARARADFRQALRETVAFHSPGSAAEIDAETALLLQSLECS